VHQLPPSDPQAPHRACAAEEPRPHRPPLRALILAACVLASCGGAQHDRPTRELPKLGPLAGVAGRADLLGDQGYAAALTAFGSVTPENELKWELSEPDRGRYDFAAADRVVDFARRHGMAVRGHALVWHLQNPAWLGDLSAGDLRAALRDHIRTLMQRYAGRIGEWDVVNEAVADTGGLRHSIWLDKLGPGYIALAFRLAHEADPRAKLFYNDYGAEGEGTKADAVYSLVARLKGQGVPIDGIGLQAHVDTRPPPGYEANIARFARLGLRVELTELDVRTRSDDAAARRAQAEQYARMVDGCGPCARFTVWGLDDADSWIPDAYPGFGHATLLDGDLRPKPAFDAFRRALLRR
jgi:endo-1,4-beta-xylanase